MIWAGGNSEKGVLSRTLKNDTKIEFFGRILSLYFKRMRGFRPTALNPALV